MWCEICATYHVLTALKPSVTHDGRTLQCVAAGRNLFWFPRGKDEAIVLNDRGLTHRTKGGK